MKLCVTILSNKEYVVYSYKDPNNKRFFVALKLFADDFMPEELVDWLKMSVLVSMKC